MFVKTRIALLLFIVVNIVVSNEASAANIVTLTPGQLSLPVSQWYALDSGDVVPSKHDHIEDWLAGHKKIPKPHFSGGRYAVYIPFTNETEYSSWVIDTEHYLSKSVDVYLYTEQSVQYIPSGFEQADRFFLSYAREVDIPPASQGGFIFIVGSDEYNQTPSFNLWQKADFIDQHNSNIFWVVLFIGVLFSLCIVTLFIAIGTRSTISYIYFFYLVALLMAWCGRYEVLQEVFGGQIYSLMYVPFLLLPLLGGYFCISFLRLDRYMPQLAYLIKINGGLALIMAFISPWFFEYANQACSVFVTIWVVSAIYAGYARYRQGFVAAKYYLLAFFWLALPTAIMMPRNFGFYDMQWLDIELFTLVGGALDGAFLGFAIAYRAADINRDVVRLRHADLSKSQFLANMSHEIRTPLTSIIGYSDALLKQEIPISQQQNAVEIIANSGQHLLGLINNILDLSKIEENKFEFAEESIDVVKVMNDVEGMLVSKAECKNIVLSFQYSLPIPQYIEVDGLRIKQVLINVISNAIKFTDDGYVKVSVSHDGDYLNIAVSDTGVGINSVEQKQIFEPFYQGQSQLSDKPAGTGLGLNIAKTFVDAMGGQIAVVSRLGFGSTFTISLPHKANAESLLFNIKPITNSQPEKTVPCSVKGEHKNVLLAEDNIDNRALIRLILESFDLNVIEANDGQEALRAVCQDDIALVLMDIHMPRMNGIEAFHALRHRAYSGPIVALTANTMKHEIESYLSIGFDAHLAKPIDRIQFSKVVRHCLQLPSTSNNRVERGTIESLVEDFINRIDSVLTDIEVQLSLHNGEQALSLLHQNKGASGSFGIAEMSVCMGLIEEIVGTDDFAEGLLLLQRFRAFSKKYTQVSGIDLGNAIIAFDNDVEEFYEHISPAIEHCIELLGSAIGMVERGTSEDNNLMSILLELQQVASSSYMKDCGRLAADAIQQLNRQASHKEILEIMVACLEIVKDYRRLLSLPHWDR